MGLGETGNLMGESQAFPWEGGASRSELNEMIACGKHTLKRDGAEQSEAERVVKNRALTRCISSLGSAEILAAPLHYLIKLPSVAAASYSGRPDGA